MTDDEIKAGLAVCAAATAGPWHVEACKMLGREYLCNVLTQPGGAELLEFCPPEDAAFAVAARVGWPAALKALQETRAKATRYERGRSKYLTAYNELASAISPGSVDPHADLAALKARIAELEAQAPMVVVGRDGEVRALREQTDEERQRAEKYERLYREEQRRHAQVDAQAAAMRGAFEALVVDQGVDCDDDDCPGDDTCECLLRAQVNAALAPDAGRALLAELNDLRGEVEAWRAATGCGTAEQWEARNNANPGSLKAGGGA